jgi:metallo-beta-lactamase class B
VRLLLVLILPLTYAQRNAEERTAWNRPLKPFRIAGNIHYVGVEGVSAFLITSPAGHILLDGGFPESAPLIEKNIAGLGFKLSDVKFLLNSHAHYDHCGGLTVLKSRSGASMVASAGDTGADRKLSCSDPSAPFPPVAVDRVIADRETVRVGDVVLTAHLTPGHTKGCTTWSMPVNEHNVVFYCSTTVVGKLNPESIADYEETFAKLKRLPCDIFLAPHAGFFRLHQKRGRPGAFVDPAEMQRHVAQSEREFRRLAAGTQKR